MREDYHRNNPCKKAVEQLVLIDVCDMLQAMEKDIRSFSRPLIDSSNDVAAGVPREIYEKRIIEVNEEDKNLHKSLNTEQMAAYKTIMSTVDSPNGGVFFIDGLGGTGKTFLYRALLGTVRSQEKIVVATATSGVAASIMPGGRTAHSRFKIPLNIDEGGYCNFTKQSGTAKLLCEVSLILWDEASMTKRQAIEALDISLHDILDKEDLAFGGKTVVFGGDFRQTLPFVRKGSRAQIVNASMCSSYLWDLMQHLTLERNMRAQKYPEFADFLLRIGGGTEEINDKDEVLLPESLCIPYTGDDKDLDSLIDWVFSKLDDNKADSNYITSRAILCTKNDCVDRINMKMINKFQGDERVYHSFDEAVDDPNNYYPSEFLNTLTPNGLPPHVLKLKKNCPIILLWNIDPTNGLCNGTRLVVRNFQKNVIDAEIVLGQHARKRVFLPRIPFCPSDDEMFPFQFKRKQFPIRLSFTMTINKAQGQTISNVGIFLPDVVFSHGQLYVALSRATAKQHVKVLTYPADHYTRVKGAKLKAVRVPKGKKGTRQGKIKEVVEKTNGGTYTKNIVYNEILT
jgi:ATP-dependent DNA helicase PIF1